MASEQNLKDLVHENQEKDDWIRELEEEVRHGKRDKGILKEFKICVERVRKNSMRWKLTCMKTSKSSNSWWCKS
jgi:hypothetical protein